MLEQWSTFETTSMLIILISIPTKTNSLSLVGPFCLLNTTLQSLQNPQVSSPVTSNELIWVCHILGVMVDHDKKIFIQFAKLYPLLNPILIKTPVPRPTFMLDSCISFSHNSLGQYEASLPSLPDFRNEFDRNKDSSLEHWSEVFLNSIKLALTAVAIKYCNNKIPTIISMVMNQCILYCFTVVNYNVCTILCIEGSTIGSKNQNDDTQERRGRERWVQKICAMWGNTYLNECTGSVKRRVSYFYDPDIGNFHYGRLIYIQVPLSLVMHAVIQWPSYETS